MGKPQQVKTRWFTVGNDIGDRTLESQMQGLDPLLEVIPGKTFLDAGCAEGLISIELCKAGALAGHGVEIVPGHVKLANKLRKDAPVTFEEGNLNTWRPKRAYDVVLALAILHKLNRPDEVCAALAEAAREWFVFRLPSANKPWTIVDARTAHRPFDIGRVLEQKGFEFRQLTLGPFNEPTGFWKRRG